MASKTKQQIIAELPPDMQEFYSNLDPKGRAEFLSSIMMTDNEFELSTAGYMGPYGREQVDASNVKVIPTGPQGPAPFAGVYMPENGSLDIGYSVGLQNKGLLARGEYLEPGQITLSDRGEYGTGVTTPIAAHESWHKKDDVEGNKLDEGNHEVVYIRQAFRATTKEQWNDIVGSYAVWLSAQESREVTEDEASAILEQAVRNNFEQLAADEAQAEAENLQQDPEDAGLLSLYKERSREVADYRARRKGLNFSN